jgi:hypothetical protein
MQSGQAAGWDDIQLPGKADFLKLCRDFLSPLIYELLHDQIHKKKAAEQSREKVAAWSGCRHKFTKDKNPWETTGSFCVVRLTAHASWKENFSYTGKMLRVGRRRRGENQKKLQNHTMGRWWRGEKPENSPKPHAREGGGVVKSMKIQKNHTLGKVVAW